MSLFSGPGGRRRRTFLLGGLVTGGAGAALVTTALQHVLKRAREKKRVTEERLAKPVSSDDVEAALGEERIQWLMRQTGLTRDELLAGLRFSTEVKPERFRRYS